MKKYKLGMILGRFQIFHKGHESIINKALELCDEVIILIGSADKYGTYENPFNYDTRRIIIKEVYKDRVIIAPLNDLGVGNVPKWGDYVIESCKKIKDIPDLVIYGDEDKCKEWYKNYPNIEYFKIDRGLIPTSSSDLKKMLIDNNYDEFKKYVNANILKYYSDMRLALIKILYKKDKVESNIDYSDILDDVFDED